MLKHVATTTLLSLLCSLILAGTENWVDCIERERQKFWTYSYSYLDGQCCLQADEGPGWGGEKIDVWSDYGEDALPSISRYILCPKYTEVWRDQEFIMDENRFSIPIWTNTFIPTKQICWYKITKLGKNFDGIEIKTNITSNWAVEVYREKSHGNLELIDQTLKIQLDYNQSFFILAKSGQWERGKIDMILLESYIDGGTTLHYGFIILIVGGSIAVLILLTIVITLCIKRKKKMSKRRQTTEDKEEEKDQALMLSDDTRNTGSRRLPMPVNYSGTISIASRNFGTASDSDHNFGSSEVNLATSDM
jgi:hypothetical protein